MAKSFQYKPDPAHLKATVEKLAAFNTRNTNTPELEETAMWVAEQMRKIPDLQVELMHYRVKKDDRRVPQDRKVVQVIGVLPGETDERILVGGHMDTINLHQDIYKGRAPGANDDASGVALTLESARLLSQKKWRQTLVFIAFSGEEQGLFGSEALAERAKSEGWKISAFFNNDTVGSSKKPSGEINRKFVRVFSSASTDTQSRELARYIEFVNRRNPVKVKLILRPDRFGRGGDHTPFNRKGFNAVRFTELYERYDHQHTDQDLPEFVDYNYLAAVTSANLNGIIPLAMAADPPAEVKVKIELNNDTTLSWHGTPGVKYQVYWRETTDAGWKKRVNVGAVSSYVAKGISKDDYVFGVAAEGGIPVEAK